MIAAIVWALLAASLLCLLAYERAVHRALQGARRDVSIPWGCTTHHGHDVEPCAPGCWLAQEDTARGDSEVDGGLVLRHRDGSPLGTHGAYDDGYCPRVPSCPLPTWHTADQCASRDTLVSEGQVAP